MANLWFRLYAEFATDPKVQSMSEAMQRRLVMLFCARCSDILHADDEATLAFYLRVSEGELAETKKLFMAKGFIDQHWDVLNWNKRQFVSDSSTERVRRHREKKHHETHETKCNARTVFHRDAESPHKHWSETARNVTVTASDTDTDTDTEKLSDAYASSPRRCADGGAKREPPELEIYSAYPRKVAKRAAIAAIHKAVKRIQHGELSAPAIADVRDAQVYLFRRVEAYARSPAGSRPDRQMIPHPATWFNQSRYLDDDADWQAVSGATTGGRNGRPTAQSKQATTIDAAKQYIADLQGMARH